MVTTDDDQQQLWGDALPRKAGPWHLACGMCKGGAGWAADRASGTPVSVQIRDHLLATHALSQDRLDAAVQVYNGGEDELWWSIEEGVIVVATLALTGPVYYACPTQPPGYDLIQLSQTLHDLGVDVPGEDVARVLFNLTMTGRISYTGGGASWQPMRWMRADDNG